MNRVFADDVIDVESNIVIGRRYDRVSESAIKQMKAAGFKTASVIDVSWDEGLLLKTIAEDHVRSTEEALKEIYQKLRPGDPPTISNAKQLLKRMFFDPRHYDLGKVGRYKINQKLGLVGQVSDELEVLDKQDLVAAIRYLVSIRKGEGTIDDIDHLGSRRVRTVGELLENQCRIGLARMERLIKERMTLFDPTTGTLMPQKLINAKPLSAIIQDFFGRSQLS